MKLKCVVRESFLDGGGGWCDHVSREFHIFKIGAYLHSDAHLKEMKTRKAHEYTFCTPPIKLIFYYECTHTTDLI